MYETETAKFLEQHAKWVIGEVKDRPDSFEGAVVVTGWSLRRDSKEKGAHHMG